MWNDENTHSVHHTDKYSQHSSIIWPVWVNGTNWVLVRVSSQSLWNFASVIFSDIIFPYEYVFAATKKSYNN